MPLNNIYAFAAYDCILLRSRVIVNRQIMLSRNSGEVYKKGLLPMSDLYNRIETLCKNENMTITTMCKESGASRASLSDLKVGRKQKLSTDTLSKIAKTLGVSVSFLLGDETQWSDAVEKFGFCWEARFREDKKAEARAVISSPEATDAQKYDAQIIVFKALFSRSLEASGYNLNHIDFPTYISMMLPQDQWKTNIPASIYRRMVVEYGTTPGIPQGTYYTATEKAPTPEGERPITFDDFTYAMYEESKELTEENKKKLLEMAQFFRQQQEKDKQK